jgi:hypothetical protein
VIRIDDVLQRFRKFKSMIISADLPSNILLDIIESYITAEDEDLPVEEIPVLDGQLSLLDVA